MVCELCENNYDYATKKNEEQPWRMPWAKYSRIQVLLQWQPPCSLPLKLLQLWCTSGVLMKEYFVSCLLECSLIGTLPGQVFIFFEALGLHG